MRSPDPGKNLWLYRLAAPRLPAILRVTVATSIALLAGYQLTGQITGQITETSMSRSEAAPQASARSDTEAASRAPEAIDPFETLVLDVQPGDTLDNLFRESGLSLVDLAEILQLDAARQNLRILRPGDTLSVRHDNGAVLGLERDIGVGQTFVVRRNDTASLTSGAAGPVFYTELVNLPLERRIVTAGGHISSSLFEAAANAGLSEKSVMKLANIFAWDIDFSRDINTGDEFALVYEELWRNGKKLGEGEILAAEFTNRGGRFTAVRFEEADGRAEYYSADGRPMRKAFVRAPVSFARISSRFNPNRRHPILNTIRAHQGVDYAARTGTPVIASGDGKVIFRGWKSGYGNTLILQHGGNITTLYAHLSRFAKTSNYGSRVRQGEVIGYVGATGLATAAHLHYEYRKNGVHLNPQTVILPPAEPLRGAELMALQTTAQPLLARIASRQIALAANRSASR